MPNAHRLIATKVTPSAESHAQQDYHATTTPRTTTGEVVSDGNRLAFQLDPSDLSGARRCYERAAEAGDTDAMVSLGKLLAHLVDPPDLDGAQQWYGTGARAGDTDAMVNLAELLADRLDPPDVDSAQYWSEKAARAGDPRAWYRLGVIFARRGDREGVEKAWRRVIDTVDADPQTVASAAFGLAALAALDGYPDMAWPLLQVARACGSLLAAHCAASLAENPASRQAALVQLAHHAQEPAALNFLGLATSQDGARSDTIAYWQRSARSGDPVAPLLLHLAGGAAC